MKEKMIKHRRGILAGLLIVVVLTAAFLWGGSYPKSAPGDAAGIPSAENIAASPTASLPPPDAGPTASFASPDAAATPASSERPTAGASDPSDGVPVGSEPPAESPGMTPDPETDRDRDQTDPTPDGKPAPVDSPDADVTERELTCTLSVRCDTLLENMKLLDKEKWELVPADGVIFAEAAVIFYEGESVLNVLQREMKKARIQMEFKNTPMYNSAYIRGINNLYEFDAGELSGWMYKVNDWFPNYGCSRYQLREGDVVEWVYTCDLGRDVGGYYAAGGS